MEERKYMGLVIVKLTNFGNPRQACCLTILQQKKGLLQFFYITQKIMETWIWYVQLRLNQALSLTSNKPLPEKSDLKKKKLVHKLINEMSCGVSAYYKTKSSKAENQKCIFLIYLYYLST